ncbi:hypothetical protein [Moheibacter lacus]|uniref:TonB protein C-terminal n=1 Tax=Moheibacter lacus TaxID=2745851 RepID=A0A838ZHG4_9FLAO|nr:hypothetical protein [Moheibacter lacus]MBA5628698.1 hypothetical protein [Moheibacter lacus]
MKPLISFLSILFFGNFIFSQSHQLYTENKVKEMPVFPGCETVDPQDKKDMTKCIAANLSDRLLQNMKGVDEFLIHSGIYDARADVQFIISKEGILFGMKEMEGSDPILGEAAVMAMEKIAMELPPIRPAKLKDGTVVNLVFQIPIHYQLEKKEEKLADFIYPVDEIVLFTLLDEAELRYEIRLYKGKDIKVYEIKDDQFSFLGKFLTLNELESSEPYKSLIEKCKASDKILVTDGFLEKEFFEIYIYNLFANSEKEPVFVEVVKVDEKKIHSITKFEKEAEFNQSKFAPLIYRE